MIRFEDFVPEQLEKAKFLKKARYESFDSTLERMNEWQRRNSNYRIINIETVVLPNIHLKAEEGSTDVDLPTEGEFSSNWHQFLRVWYTNQ
ncbi:MAG: hypothetical protein AAFR87_29890 [Bacteroidota bacterium]